MVGHLGQSFITILLDSSKNTFILSDFHGDFIFVSFNKNGKIANNMAQQFRFRDEMTTFNEDINKLFFHEVFQGFVVIVILHELDNMAEHFAHFLNNINVLFLDTIVGFNQLRNVKVSYKNIGCLFAEHEQIVDHAN